MTNGTTITVPIQFRTVLDKLNLLDCFLFDETMESTEAYQAVMLKCSNRTPTTSHAAVDTTSHK